MQLGLAEIQIKQSSQTSQIYAQSSIYERHRHRYGFNPNYLEHLASDGLKAVGFNPQLKSLIEVVELETHPWFIGCQYHPEFLSTPRKPHPLFDDLIKCLIEKLGD